jgi:hypothetical protein
LAALPARRAAAAESVLQLPQRQADLASADDEIAAVQALYDERMASLQQRRGELLREVATSEADEKFLLANLPTELHARELRRLEPRLESAAGVLAEPTPERQHSPYTSETKLREIFERQKSEHAQRCDRARQTIANLEPIIQQLRSLALTPDPTEAEVNEILAKYEQR